MSDQLINHLKAIELQLQKQGRVLQDGVNANKDKWKYYNCAIDEVQRLNELAKAKVELAKALLRAAEKAKPKKTGTSTKEDEGKSPTKKRKTA
ncbi:unnamed protein product [Effrenium voratum]|uniref:Uncharacterized protein n=1 Tax=Effrenium voratum TaxID=2562239 RepID=A0AA36IIY5_9DINO|nr:unnamed protein product [Effrenium voratum]